ncbi:MAG: ribosome recycling factor [Clostridiales bacterium]|nr:ribosome recycling factor [Clostridiales bacterium]
MDKSISFLVKEFSTIRAGRANPSVLDRITVDYYGQKTALNAVATISTPDPRSLLIQPWDASILKEIEKSIQASDLGINPTNDGKSIRLVFPQLTEERRKDLTKQIRKLAEDSKVALRNIRREAMDQYKQEKKNSEITEDYFRVLEKEIQELLDSKISEIDELVAAKEEELLSI